MEEKKFILFLHSGNYEKLYQAVMLAITAASMGSKVYIFLFFWALKKFATDQLDVIEFPEEKEYCIDTYDSNKKNRQGSGKNDYYADDNHDDKRLIEKTKFHIGKFAVIR